MGIIFIRETLNEFICTCKPTCFHTFFVGRLFVSPAQVIQNTSGKQYIFLQYNRYLVSQYFQIIILDIPSANQDFSACHVIQTTDQIHQTRLRTSGSSNDANRLTGMDVQIDILQDFLCTVFFVSKIYILK